MKCLHFAVGSICPFIRESLPAALLVTMIILVPFRVAAQSVPNGTDINQAIPIYFGQTVNDIIDNKTRSVQVYSITVARGQQLSLLAKSSSDKFWYLCLESPATKTIVGAACLASAGDPGGGHNFTTISLDYQVAAAGTYYFSLTAYGPAVNYQLQVTAQGTPIAVPNPAQAGCLTGQIDYITYSLQLIAAGLPDEASIGGTKMCAACTVKPPAYPQLVDKLETAMSLNVGVSACYDATGSIFLLKLLHP